MTTETTFTFDGTSSSSIPGLLVVRVRRPLVGARRDDYVEIAGREGTWLFTEKAGARRITIDFDLLADSFADRRESIIALADLLDSPTGLSELVISDEPDRFHRCRLASEPDLDEWLLGASFSVEFLADPYSYANDASEEAWSATSGAPHTFTPPDKVYGIPELELTATGGTITAVTVEINGDTLVYASPSTALADGDKITISTLAYVVTAGASGDADLDGTFDPDDLDMTGVSGDFGYVAVGANSITITRTGTATSIGAVLRWRQRSR